MRSEILSPKGLRLLAQPDLAKVIQRLPNLTPFECAVVAGTLNFKLENAITLILELRNLAVQRMHADGLTYEEISELIGLPAHIVRSCDRQAGRPMTRHLMLSES